MQAFTNHRGLVAPLTHTDVDTDQIIPKQFLKRIERDGFGDFLFHDWRYDAQGAERPDFVLNKAGYKGASVLATGANFGCGSSREHAAWAIYQYGFRAIIAPSFADIFMANCYQNGLLPITLDPPLVQRIIERAGGEYILHIDLRTQTIDDEDGWSTDFSMDAFRRRCLLLGLDDIDLTLEHEEDIAAWEQRRAQP